MILSTSRTDFWNDCDDHKNRILVLHIRLDVLKCRPLLMIKCLVAFSQKNSVLIHYFTNVCSIVVDTRYFLAQGFHSRDSIQLTSIFLLFINILLVKTSFLRAAVGTLITRIPCIFNIETKPICSEQCPTWTELTCWWGRDSGWGTMHQIWKKRANVDVFFFQIFIITLPLEKS